MYSGNLLVDAVVGFVGDGIGAALCSQSKNHTLAIAVQCDAPLIFDLTVMNLFTEEFRFNHYKRWLTAEDRYKPACRKWLNSQAAVHNIASLIHDQKLYGMRKTVTELTMDCEFQTEFEGVNESLRMMWELAKSLEDEFRTRY
jgi:hypothetical protein